MQILPRNIIPEDKFIEIFNMKEGLNLGFITMPSVNQIERLLKDWTEKIDRMMEFCEERSEAWELYLNERGFTFKEYQLLFKNIDEQKYDLYPIFELLLIPSRDYLIEFSNHYGNDFNGYLEALKYCVRQRKMRGLTYFLNKLEYLLSITELRRHVYISGATGSGKSQLLRLLFYRLQQESTKTKSSLILIDPHSDLSQEIISNKLTAKLKANLIIIDPDIKNGFSPVINPLEFNYNNEEEIVNHAQDVMFAIESIVGSDLSKNMSALLIPCLSLLIRRKGSTLLDLLKLMEDDRGLIEEGARVKNHAHKMLFKDFRSKYKPSKKAIAARLQSFLNYPGFYNFTHGKSTIDLEKEISEGKVIIFNLSRRYFGQEGSLALGKFIIALIKSYALRRGAERTPTYLFLDECQKFMSKSISEILDQTRKYALHLILANQSIERLKEYEDDILSNTSVKFTGSTDSQKTQNVIASISNIDVEKLQRLDKFNFFVKTRDSEGVVIKPDDLLIDNEDLSLSIEEANKLKLSMLNKYYIEVTPLETDSNEIISGTKFEL